MCCQEEGRANSLPHRFYWLQHPRSLWAQPPGLHGPRRRVNGRVGGIGQDRGVLLARDQPGFVDHPQLQVQNGRRSSQYFATWILVQVGIVAKVGNMRCRVIPKAAFLYLPWVIQVLFPVAVCPDGESGCWQRERTGRLLSVGIGIFRHVSPVLSSKGIQALRYYLVQQLRIGLSSFQVTFKRFNKIKKKKVAKCKHMINW